MRAYLVYVSVACSAAILIIYANISVREIVAPIQLSPCSCSRPRPQANLTSSLSDTTVAFAPSGTVAWGCVANVFLSVM